MCGIKLGWLKLSYIVESGIVKYMFSVAECVDAISRSDHVQYAKCVDFNFLQMKLYRVSMN